MSVGAKNGVSVDRPMVPVPRHVRCVSVEGIPSDQSKIESRLACRVVRIRACRNLFGFCKTVSIGILGQVIGQRHRKVAFDRCVELVLNLYANGVSRGVGFVIEGGGGLERTIRIHREEGVAVARTTHQVVGQSRPGIRIGCIEFTYDGPDRLVLGEGEGSGGGEVGGRLVAAAAWCLHCDIRLAEIEVAVGIKSAAKTLSE